MAPRSLLDAVVVLAPGTVLERQQTADGPRSARLRADDRVAELGPDLGELVARLNGARLREAVDAVLGPDPDDAGPDDADPEDAGPDDARGHLVEQITAIATQLVEAGFLTEQPAADGDVESLRTGPASTAPRRRDLATDVPERAALHDAGRALKGAGFSSANLHDLLSHPAAGELTGGERAAARHRLAAHGTGALPLLARAFVLDEPVEEEALDGALGSAATAALLNSGLLRRDGDRLEPAVRIATYADPAASTPLLLAHDGPAAEGRNDLVPGLHQPSITLADFTPRRAVGSALDMGTGNGLQALLLAGHAGRVVATDLNPRAIGYAGINAALNDLRLDLRVGSLLEPVAGETFDLLVSNPPYVLSPETELVFRDSGYPGDTFNQLVATSVSGALTPGGTAVVLLSWSQPPDVTRPRPLQWLDDATVDADGLLVLTGMADAVTEAASWNREYAGDPARHARQIDRWLQWYAAQGIEQIGYGALTLRRINRARSDRAAWRFALPGEPRSGPCGDHIDRILAGHGELAKLDDGTLLTGSLRLRSGCGTRVTSTSGPQGWEHRTSVGINPGLGVTATVDSQQQQALWRLSSSEPRPITTLADLLAPDELAAFVRGLVEAGFAELDVVRPATKTRTGVR